MKQPINYANVTGNGNDEYAFREFAKMIKSILEERTNDNEKVPNNSISSINGFDVHDSLAG